MAGGERTSTATIVFTDVVGSTARRARVGDDVADRLALEHERLLAEVIEASNGRVVKGTGDGIMAAFDAAADAVGAAIACQIRVEASNRRLPEDHRTYIRVGISGGDVTWAGGDVHGTPVVEASRLCDAAGQGGILCSELVRLLARSRAGDVFGASATFDLKGLAEPLTACQLIWRVEGDSSQVPAALRSLERFAFVGRTPELDTLDRAWKRACAAERPVVLIGGEPGLGKTRLAAEFATRVAGGGALVLAGRCDEEIQVPYQPFVESFRSYASLEGDLELGADAGELVRLWPGLSARIPGLPDPLRVDPETERYRLMDAVAGWLSAASAADPILLVLDDLHWATTPTLLMLRHVARSPHPMRIMLLITYRDTETAGEVADCFADLRRSGAERIPLAGLDRDAVNHLLEAAAEHPLDERALSLGDALHQETRGNPFFLGEVLSHLAETGAIYQEDDGRWTSALDASEIPIPESVRDVVRRRLGRLSDGANSVLQIAAIVGRDFEHAIVGTAEGDLDAALDHLEEAATAGLIEEIGVGRYRFSHALVRDALYESVTPTRRARMHRRIGEAFEATYANREEAVLTELSHHFGAAVVPGEATRAIDYARRAGVKAMGRLAYEEAAVEFRRALDVAVLAPDSISPEDHCGLRISLAEAVRWIGSDDAKTLEDEAVDAALALGARDLILRAAFLNPALTSYSLVGQVDERRVHLLQAALDAIGDTESPDRALLLARKASELAFSPRDRQHREEAANEALAIARRSGDEALLFEILAVRFSAFWSSEGLAERRASIAECLQLIDRLGSYNHVRTTDQYFYIVALEDGDIDMAEAAVRRASEVAARFKLVYGRHSVTEGRLQLASVAGRFDEADTLALEAYEQSQVVRADAFLNYSLTVFILRYLQGRANEIVELAIEAEGDMDIPALSCGIPPALLQCGRVEEARARYDEIARQGFVLPMDPGWGAGMTMIADACAGLGDADGARILYDRLLPFAGQACATALYYFGSHQHSLGDLARTFGELDDAMQHYRAAEAWEAGMRAPVWTARARLGQAEVLLARGEREAAREIAAACRSIGEAHSAFREVARAEALLEPRT